MGMRDVVTVYVVSLLELVILHNELHVRLNVIIKHPFKQPLGKLCKNPVRNPLKQTLERALRNFPRLLATTANERELVQKLYTAIIPRLSVTPGLSHMQG